MAVTDRAEGVLYDPVKQQLLSDRKIKGLRDVPVITPTELDTTLETFVPNPVLDNYSAGTPRFITTADKDKTIVCSGGPTLRIPNDASSDSNGTFKVGTKVTIIQSGFNQLSIIAHGGSVLLSNNGYTSSFKTNGSNAVVELVYLGSNQWIISGDVTVFSSKSYAVTAAGGKYIFNGEGFTDEQAPALTFSKNQPIKLAVDASGHPFWVDTVQAAQASEANPGFAYISNHGTESGDMIIRFTETGSYYYNCGNHAAMGNTITVV